ncbi:PREDICTED: C-type lectin domain family 10 member A [Condylura cristata]|uniref:C-type lectin domain family 10 member A n=1 Tax=Condylura cristata TaxID=143302 RepID=UPI0006431A09|nr:PREDICTED: C-type lectin domain family 10 member A [Condylura cristata]
MAMKYENFQNVESENKSQWFGNGLPLPQSLLCSGPRPVLICLALNFLLLVGICVVGSQNSRFQRDLVTLRTTFSNVTTEVQSLNSRGDRAQETLTSLKAEVENHKQELQAARSLNDKVFSLESKLEKQLQEFKAGYSEIPTLLQQLVEDLKSLSCKITLLKSNGSQTTCCPTDWLEHGGSCYWFSHSGKPWPEAEKYCQLENAYLVVINSREEQNFVQKHLSASYTWMGLSDPEGVWKWADGTDYDTNFKNWKPGQPDDWHGHGLGGGEDCAHFHPDGRWNDDACQRDYRWVCETGLSSVS